MKRALPILLVILSVCCPSLFAEDKPDSSRPVSLAHRFSANQAVRYKIVQHITGSRTFPGSDKSAPIDAELKSIIRMQCSEINGEGIATISFEIESGSLKIGKREANAFAAGSMPRTLQVTPSGKVLFPQQEEQVGDISTRRVLMDSGAIEPLIILAGLPEQAIAVGGSWSADVVLPSATRVKITSALREVNEVSGERAAVIVQTQTTPSTSDGPPASQNRQEAQSKLIFGINTGRLLWAEGNIHSVISVLTPRLSKEPETSTLTLDTKFKVEMLEPS